MILLDAWIYAYVHVVLPAIPKKVSDLKLEREKIFFFTCSRLVKRGCFFFEVDKTRMLLLRKKP